VKLFEMIGETGDLFCINDSDKDQVNNDWAFLCIVWKMVLHNLCFLKKSSGNFKAFVALFWWTTRIIL